MTVCVRFSEVTKQYDQQPVLRGVDAQCPQGCTSAIVGASGSGKTTMLQMVNGVVQPDGGHVEVFGEPVPDTGLEGFRRGIGYAVQGAALFPHMSAKQNVTLVARLEGWSEADMDERFAQLLAEMELAADVASRLPRELSGGQQQRLGLCRALMLRPKLLLLDEPFSAVDPITRVDIYERFEWVQKHEGVSSLLVTHDLREAKRLADHLIILNDGQIAQQGPTDTVLANPVDDYVNRLVQSQLA